MERITIGKRIRVVVKERYRDERVIDLIKPLAALVIAPVMFAPANYVLHRLERWSVVECIEASRTVGFARFAEKAKPIFTYGAMTNISLQTEQ